MKQDPDARGIRLMVGSTTKTWVMTRRIDGRVRTITLGSWPDLPTLFDARDVAKEKQQATDKGTDEATTGIRTLRDAIERHILNSGASSQTHDYYRQQIDRHLSNLFAKDVEKVTLASVEDALRPHIVMVRGKRRASSTYSHIRQIISTACKVASVHRMIPDVSKGVQPPPPAPVRNKVQFDTQADWPILDMIAKKKETNLLVGAGWELMLFTGLRSKNAKELRWSDIDLDRKYMSVDVTKTTEGIKFPLCDRIVDLLTNFPRTSEWVFPHRNDHSRHCASFGRELVQGKARVTPHDSRRLFTTAVHRCAMPAYVAAQFRADKGTTMAEHYDQGSMTHHQANEIARQIEVQCGILPDYDVVQLKRLV